MNVLILSHIFPAPAAPGAADFVRRQLQRLIDAGIRIRVVSPAPYAPPVPAWSSRIRTALEGSRSKPRTWEIYGVPVYAPRFWKLPGRVDFGMYGPLYYRGIRSLVRKLYAEEPFDLVHGQWLVPDGYAAALIGRKYGVPSISTERGYVARYADWGARAAAVRRAIRRVDQIVTISKALAERVRELETPKQPIRVVYNGVDTDRFTPHSPSEARQALGLPDARYVVCCARVEQIKQPGMVLAAFRTVLESIPEARLVWIGQGSALELLRADIAAAGIRDKVLLPGDVPHADVPQWLAAADVIVQASRNEGLGNSLIEASASGRPIVATRVGGIPEVVADGETGLLVDRDDVEGLGQSLLRILKDKQLAERMGDCAREHACRRFSWQTYTRDMLDVYHSVLQRQ